MQFMDGLIGHQPRLDHFDFRGRRLLGIENRCEPIQCALRGIDALFDLEHRVRTIDRTDEQRIRDTDACARNGPRRDRLPFLTDHGEIVRQVDLVIAGRCDTVGFMN